MAAKKLMSFVTQEQADELKKKRQEEWERVRKPEDPKGEVLTIKHFACCYCAERVWLIVQSYRLWK